jgi:hypothetical protein
VSDVPPLLDVYSEEHQSELDATGHTYVVEISARTGFVPVGTDYYRSDALVSFKSATEATVTLLSDCGLTLSTTNSERVADGVSLTAQAQYAMTSASTIGVLMRNILDVAGKSALVYQIENDAAGHSRCALAIDGAEVAAEMIETFLGPTGPGLVLVVAQAQFMSIARLAQNDVVAATQALLQNKCLSITDELPGDPLYSYWSGTIHYGAGHVITCDIL